MKGGRMAVKDSSEYGWLVMSRAEYERMQRHDYAGPGTPLNPNAGGAWCLVNENGATVLYTGVEVVA
jgi:hypothetical protein